MQRQEKLRPCSPQIPLLPQPLSAPKHPSNNLKLLLVCFKSRTIRSTQVRRTVKGLSTGSLEMRTLEVESARKAGGMN